MILGVCVLSQCDVFGKETNNKKELNVQKLVLTINAKNQLKYFSLGTYVGWGIKGHLLINGIKIYKFKNRFSGNTFAVQPWVMPGNNRFTLVIEKIADEPKDHDSRAHLVEIEFRGMEEQGIPQDADNMCSMTIDLADVQGKNMPIAHNYTFNIDKKSFQYRRLWDEAEQIDSLTEEDKKEMMKLRNELADTYNALDFDSAANLLTYYFEDRSASTGLSVEDEKKAFVSMLNMTKKHYGFEKNAVMPFPIDNAKFDLLSNNRVVSLESSAGKGAILLNCKKGAFKIDSGYFVKVNGKWIILNKN